ncbi:hypothetical protein EXS70_04590 [Candidatus Peribacteria bacterium]|nr:hypothetical protein [Candidatus Peribacteria bacterium]
MAQEECDNGSRNSDTGVNACRTTCVKAHCGDGVADSGEICDHGSKNGTAGDTCASNCQPTTVRSSSKSSSSVSLCGNGRREGSEKCDDGNTKNRDGCSSTCVIEGGWECQPQSSSASSGPWVTCQTGACNRAMNGSSCGGVQGICELQTEIHAEMTGDTCGTSQCPGQCIACVPNSSLSAQDSSSSSSSASAETSSSSSSSSISSSSVAVTCTDTELDPNPMIAGTVTLSGGQTYSDSCTAQRNGVITTSEIMEESCSRGIVHRNVHLTEQVPCPLGSACSNGACHSVAEFTPPPGLCSDSDGGFDLTVRGSGTSTGQLPFSDSCPSGPNFVYEYFCTGGIDPAHNIVHAVADLYHCPVGTACSNGACQ